MLTFSTKAASSRITLNRPGKRNALNLELCQDCSDASIMRATTGGRRHSDTGHGPAFCAGMDLKDSLEADPSSSAGARAAVYRHPSHSHADDRRGPWRRSGRGHGPGGQRSYRDRAPGTRFRTHRNSRRPWPIMVFRAIEMAIGERRAAGAQPHRARFHRRRSYQYGLVTEIAEDPVKRAAEIATVLRLQPLAVSPDWTISEQIRGQEWEEAGRIGHELRESAAAERRLQGGGRGDSSTVKCGFGRVQHKILWIS